MIKDDSHHKKFQLDRIALFSDAVFAIAITLLIIEIKVPEIEHPYTDSKMLEALGLLIGKFIGLLVSFFVIGRYWIFHHRLFGYVTNYNGKLLWVNLWFLLSIVLMPFSSAFFSEYYVNGLRIPLIFYVLNICFTGFMNNRLLTVVSNPKYKLSIDLRNTKIVRFYQQRSAIAPAVFLFAAILSFLNLYLAYAAFLLIPVFSIIINRYYRKHHSDFFN
ncbi:TMEM175 family protein [Mucilaginibacter sp.]|uniref:TMEM175 family protein n=1 Tax=Mucilaginibacter sp. TaxID=1882438 RepID=UPI0035BBD631